MNTNPGLLFCVGRKGTKYATTFFLSAIDYVKNVNLAGLLRASVDKTFACIRLSVLLQTIC